jgi:hypothetical protein
MTHSLEKLLFESISQKFRKQCAYYQEKATNVAGKVVKVMRISRTLQGTVGKIKAAM